MVSKGDMIRYSFYGRKTIIRNGFQSNQVDGGSP